jgi:hypothetical protein
MIFCCLLCALSSSYSPLALAVLRLFQLIQCIRAAVDKLIQFRGGRICLIQVFIHESILQTIQIKSCLLRPDGAHYLDELDG